MSWLENITRVVLFWTGLLGVVVIYGGFLFLLFAGGDTREIHWYFLLSPWLCVYFGLGNKAQAEVNAWLKGKFNSSS